MEIKDNQILNIIGTKQVKGKKFRVWELITITHEMKDKAPIFTLESKEFTLPLKEKCDFNKANTIESEEIIRESSANYSEFSKIYTDILVVLDLKPSELELQSKGSNNTVLTYNRDCYII